MNFTGVYYNETDYHWHVQTKRGNDVWLGIHIIIRGGSIGAGAVIGGKSIVTKDVVLYGIWVGNLARFIRKRFDDETIEKLLEAQWWNWDDEKLGRYGEEFQSPEEFLKIL